MKASAADTRTTPPSAAPGRHPQRWLILGVICLAQLTVLLDNTVLSVAIPSSPPNCTRPPPTSSG